MEQIKRPANDFPIRLNTPRAWRTYLGGSQLDLLHGRSGEDVHFPEEWIMSVVAARNAGREDYPDEGMSFLADFPELSLKQLLEENATRYLGRAHTERSGAALGVLLKLIDSAERLTLQVHPDRGCDAAVWQPLRQDRMLAHPRRTRGRRRSALRLSGLSRGRDPGGVEAPV